jgi:serine/threonine-protein kinase
VKVTVPDALGLGGRTVSHFRVLEPIGAGGMGVVYRGEDLRLHRTVALKFMVPGYIVDDTATARFLREAQAVAALDHANICTIHEVGESEDGHLFLAMSHYTGETLKDRLTRVGRVSVEQALDFATQITRGLACAHAAGIVHRDLKPANVMLTGDGTVKILDFGLAKARDQTMTVSGVAMGTVAYMSPEQLFGERVDARSDLYSLGVVVYEMLTGQHPSRGDDVAGTLTRQVEAQQPGTVAPELTDSVRRLVERLLRKDPDERYQSAVALLADLQALRDSVAATTRPSALVQARQGSVDRRRLALGGVAFLLVVVLSSAVWWVRTLDRHDRDSQGAPTGSSAPVGVAVLPLKNYSGPDQEYFADGMTEELTSTLTKIEALRVIAHQSTTQFKRSDRAVPEIARLLDVKYLVDGSVSQDSSRIRVTASLIDATQNTPVWSNTFYRDKRDVMELQRELALAIAQAIEVKLTPQDRTRLAPARVVNPEAYNLYIKGTQARYEATFNGNLTKPKVFFEQSIALDSSYAPSYAGLALVYTFLGDTTRARWFANRAQQLDPQLADARVAEGLIRQLFDWDLPGGEAALLKALQLAPGLTEAHHELSMLLMRRARFDSAVAEARTALSQAPTVLRFLSGLGEVTAYAGRTDEALAVADRLVAMDSATTAPYYVRGVAYEQRKQYEEAARAGTAFCSRVPSDACVTTRGHIGYAYAMMGRKQAALLIADTLRKEIGRATTAAASNMREMGLAIIYAGLGDRGAAIDWLERAAEPHTEQMMLYLGVDPVFRSLRGEPRFQALLKKIGLPAVP